MSLMNDGVKRIAFGYTRISTEEQTYGASLESLNEAAIDYVCNFITKPAKLWKDANLEMRQAFQKNAISKRLTL